MRVVQINERALDFELIADKREALRTRRAHGPNVYVHNGTMILTKEKTRASVPAS